MKLNYKKITTSAKDPVKAHKFDAGWDLFADKGAIITTSSLASIPTGIAVDIPSGYYGQIQERSGFSLKNTLKIKAGVVDAGYQGEISIIFVNTGEAPVKIYEGDKVAQIVFHKLPLITLEEVKDFAQETERGTKGFGSSDVGQKSKITPVKKGNTVTAPTSKKKK